MSTGKLCLAAFLIGMPALAAAQPSVSVDVGVNVGVDAYDTIAPGDPVESVDVFYDQLSPYGVWVDEPNVGRAFIPDTADFVPYTTGHWEYTNLGFVWISTEPYAWATTHYGRWAYSRAYGRWYWLPDTQWGPAWVEWRQTGTDFGWAPLAPEIVVRAGWQPPAESWHYCSAEHVLDPNLVRYYEPRERVVEIHRQARPIEHYSTISNVRVAVGPPAATLREHRVAIHRVKVEPRTVGRWTPAEAHAQAARASEHRATFEVQNQQRIARNARLHTAQVKVIETHPQIKAEVTARVAAGGARPAEPSRGVPPRAEPGHRPNEPARVEPGRPGEPERGAPRPEHAQQPPQHEAKPPVAQPPAQHTPEPAREQHRPEHAQPPQQHEAKPPVAQPPAQHAPEPAREQHRPEQGPPQHEAKPPVAQPPAQHTPEPVREQHRPEHAQPPQHQPPAPARAPEPTRRAPEPEHAQPQRDEPAHGAERKPPERKEPERKDDRKEPDRH